MMGFSITHHVWSRAVVVVAFFNASVFSLRALLERCGLISQLATRGLQSGGALGATD